MVAVVAFADNQDDMWGEVGDRVYPRLVQTLFKESYLVAQPVGLADGKRHAVYGQIVIGLLSEVFPLLRFQFAILADDAAIHILLVLQTGYEPDGKHDDNGCLCGVSHVSVAPYPCAHGFAHDGLLSGKQRHARHHLDDDQP